jgi:hypothetical protein
MWISKDGRLNTNAFDPSGIETAVAILDLLRTQDTGFVAQLDAMVEEVIEMTSVALESLTYDKTTEAPYKRKWAPDEVLNTMSLQHWSSVDALRAFLNTVDLRWRLDMINYVEDILLEFDERQANPEDLDRHAVS